MKLQLLIRFDLTPSVACDFEKQICKTRINTYLPGTMPNAVRRPLSAHVTARVELLGGNLRNAAESYLATHDDHIN